jgi:hypothetical protein
MDEKWNNNSTFAYNNNNNDNSENNKFKIVVSGIGIGYSLRRLATGWTVQGSNSRGGEIFRTRCDQPCDPPILLYNGYWVCFPRSIPEQGRDVDFPLHLSPRLKSKAIPLLPLWASIPCSRVNYLIGPNVIVIHTLLRFECVVIYSLSSES